MFGKLSGGPARRSFPRKPCLPLGDAGPAEDQRHLGCESTIRHFEFVRAATGSTAQVRTEVAGPPKGLRVHLDAAFDVMRRHRTSKNKQANLFALTTPLRHRSLHGGR